MNRDTLAEQFTVVTSPIMLRVPTLPFRRRKPSNVRSATGRGGAGRGCGSSWRRSTGPYSRLCTWTWSPGAMATDGIPDDLAVLAHRREAADRAQRHLVARRDVRGRDDPDGIDRQRSAGRRVRPDHGDVVARVEMDGCQDGVRGGVHRQVQAGADGRRCQGTSEVDIRCLMGYFTATLHDLAQSGALNSTAG